MSMDVAPIRPTKLKRILTEIDNAEKDKLLSFSLSGKDLDAIPSEIGRLRNLRTLNLSINRLKNLPTEITNLTHLENLDLRAVYLEVFPLGINQLSNLQTLDLGYNQLYVLPSSICNLQELRTLNLQNNKFVSLPSEIGKLTKLNILDLSNNQLTSLPPEITNLKSLKTLDLRGNNLGIPVEIAEKIYDPDTVLTYYFSSNASKRQRFLNETKLVTIGQGSVGKTSLIRRLMHNDFKWMEEKTDGISITHWAVKNLYANGNSQGDINSNAQYIQLNIWDFGGQEIMHATHQFFLTRRSLYLLVLDSRLTQEENRVEYWLKIIQSFAGESPVLIIGNKIDQHPLDIDRTGLRKKYTNIVGIFETSAATGTGIEELKVIITELVNKLPHIHDLFPESWFTIKTQLEALGRQLNFITYDKFLELCIANAVGDETSQRTLIAFLHDLGVVLHFQDDPRLEALGILNPQWVTNGVYKILNAKALFQNHGVLTTALLDDILNLPEYPHGKRLFIVDMMKKFELCYDIEPDITFLVPDLLPKDEPYIGEWDGSLAFQYHYNVLPTSIISRFIVRMNAYIHKTVWRLGVILKDREGNIALVKADIEDKRIYIWIKAAEITGHNLPTLGPSQLGVVNLNSETTCRDFLSAIRTEFDAIHRTIARIEATEKVPHPDYPELILDYSELIQFERDGIVEFPRSVSGKTIMVNVHQLLNGISRDSKHQREEKITDIQIEKGFAGNLTGGNENVTDSIGQARSLVQVSERSQSVSVMTKSQHLLPRILSTIFISIPKIIGRAVLDVFGRGKDSADTTSVILGYVLMTLTILLLWGIIDINSLRDWFTSW